MADDLERHLLARRRERDPVVAAVVDEPQARQLLDHRRRGRGRDAHRLGQRGRRRLPVPALQQIDLLHVVLCHVAQHDNLDVERGGTGLCEADLSARASGRRGATSALAEAMGVLGGVGHGDGQEARDPGTRQAQPVPRGHPSRRRARRRWRSRWYATTRLLEVYLTQTLALCMGHRPLRGRAARARPLGGAEAESSACSATPPPTPTATRSRPRDRGGAASAVRPLEPGRARSPTAIRSSCAPGARARADALSNGREGPVRRPARA